MSPQRATRTSFQPSEGEAFDYKINVRLHSEEAEQMKERAKGEPLAAWIRSVLRREMSRK